VAQAQQTDRARRIGVLMGFGENDAEGTLWLSSGRDRRASGCGRGSPARLDVGVWPKISLARH
jgi:hypothetical protein